MRSASGQRTFQRARELMERCLRPGQSPDLCTEYPLVFEERFSGNVVAYEADGDVRSTCAVLVRELLLDGSRLRVGLIGSVATEENWRGRGLATRVLELAEANLAREGCALALLWADAEDFYAARGYRPIGWEVDFLLPVANLVGLTSDATLRALAPDDSAAVHRLYSHHATRVDRTVQETAALLDCPGMTTLVLQRQRDVVAYACLGRGGDFANTVHEWGGAAQDVVALLAEHARRLVRNGFDGSIALIAPPSATGLRERLQILGAQVHEGVLAMAKVLDRENLCEHFDRCGGNLRADRQCDSSSATSVVVRGPRGERALDDPALLKVLFAPRGNRRAVLELENALGASAPQLPLAPFVWGLDSI